MLILFAIAFCSPYLVTARLLFSGPEDLYAFPKSRVTFLNNFPVSNDTAQRWLREGLKGGEFQFVNDSWEESTWYPPTSVKEISGSEAQSPPYGAHSRQIVNNHTLEHIKLGPEHDFLCLIPPPRDTSPVPEELDRNEAIRNGWSLLQPLTGKCLYHRQTWFTYSYCHDHEARQFKELPANHPRAQGSYEPTEDPEWEAFILGRAPTTPEAAADMIVADQFPQPANLEVGHGPDTRYLVQRWGDGTFCDKTGRPREVEVQFHCSMTMTDSILFVREAKTCSYVLVVQTPRLCGEPGFKSHPQNQDESLIQCRQIIDATSIPSSSSEDSTELDRRPVDAHNTVEYDSPSYILKRESRFPIPSPAPIQGSIGAESGTKNDPWNGVLRRTMEALIKDPEIQALASSNQQVYINRGQDGEIIIEIMEEIPMDDDATEIPRADQYSQLTDVLRKAGFDIRDERETNTEGGRTREPEEDEDSDSRDLKDEL